MLRTISEVHVEPGCHLRLTFAGGSVSVVDFRPLIDRGGVFAALADPKVFSQVALGERGRYIEWPNEVDFCADALWRAGQMQDNVGDRTLFQSTEAPFPQP